VLSGTWSCLVGMVMYVLNFPLCLRDFFGKFFFIDIGGVCCNIQENLKVVAQASSAFQLQPDPYCTPLISLCILQPQTGRCLDLHPFSGVRRNQRCWVHCLITLELHFLEWSKLIYITYITLAFHLCSSNLLLHNRLVVGRRITEQERVLTYLFPS